MGLNLGKVIIQTEAKNIQNIVNIQKNSRNVIKIDEGINAKKMEMPDQIVNRIKTINIYYTTKLQDNKFAYYYGVTVLLPIEQHKTMTARLFCTPKFLLPGGTSGEYLYIAL